MKYVLIETIEDPIDGVYDEEEEIRVFTNKDDLIDQLLSWLHMRVERR